VGAQHAEQVGPVDQLESSGGVDGHQQSLCAAHARQVEQRHGRPRDGDPVDDAGVGHGELAVLVDTEIRPTDPPSTRHHDVRSATHREGVEPPESGGGEVAGKGAGRETERQHRALPGGGHGVVPVHAGFDPDPEAVRYPTVDDGLGEAGVSGLGPGDEAVLAVERRGESELDRCHGGLPVR
jgi:hypothetical protein